MISTSRLLTIATVAVVAACTDRTATGPDVGPSTSAGDPPLATGGVTILLPGEGYQARAITPAGWVLGFSGGTGAAQVMVSWEPNGSWQLDTVVGGPIHIPERLTNSLGDAAPGTGAPTSTGPGTLTEVFLATNGGGPYTSAGNRLAAPAGVRESPPWYNYGASHLNRDRVLVGSAFTLDPGNAFYWPHIEGGWPEARRLPGPSWMTGSMAGAINDSGLVVGDAGDGQKVHARAWRLRGFGAAMTADTLPDLPSVTGATVMEGTGVNNEGVISGYVTIGRGSFPAAWLPVARFDYRYTAAPRVLSLNNSPAQNLAVNACGWVVLEAIRGGKGEHYAVVWNVWTNAQFELPAPSGFDVTVPNDIADNGNVVGYAAVLGSLATTRRAVLWQGYVPPCAASP